jgi:hypothetical protein
MPVRAINFAALPTANTGMPDFMQSFASGAQAAAMPQQLQQQAQQRQLANSMMRNNLAYQPLMNDAQLAQSNAGADLTQQQAQYYGPNIQANMGLANAQTAQLYNQIQNPMFGKIMPGPAGQIQGLEFIRRQYGENSPQYQQAKSMVDMNMQSAQSRIGYQDVLANSMAVRALTPTGKGIVEQGNINQGFLPTGQPQGGQQPQQLPLSQQDIAAMANNPQAQALGVTVPKGQQQMPQQGQPMMPGQQLQAGVPGIQLPASQQDLSNQYNLLRQKNDTDSDTRKRNLFATNLEKTFQNINPDALTQYSGLSGGAQLLGQKLASLMGSTSQNYKDYVNSQTAADFAGTQMRQFYGDSVQPAQLERIHALTNPTGWMTSPDVAKQRLMQAENILGQETGTYRDALTSTAPFQSQGGLGQQAKAPSNSGVRKFNPSTGRIE